MPAAKSIASSTSKTTRGGRRRRDRKMTIRMHRNTTMGALRTRMMFVTMLLLFLRVAVPDHHGSCFGLSTGSGSRIRKNNPNTNMNTDVTTTTMRLTPRAVAVFALLESSKKQQQTTTTTKNRKDTSNIALRLLENNNPSYLQLDARDRAFARLLLSTSERRYGQLDAIIASFQHKNKKNTKTNTKNENENENNGKNNHNDDDAEKKKSNKKKKTTGKPRVSDLLTDAALRIGATQILFMDTPVYAAVSETVEVLRMHPKIKISKAQISYVNAVLRNIDRTGRERLESETSIVDNVDPWLAKQWMEQYGKDTTTTIVATAMSQSPVFITINHRYPQQQQVQEHEHNEQEERIEQLEQMKDLFTTIDEETGEMVPAELLPTGSIRVDNFGGVVSKWPRYDDGLWWVQDVSATLPAMALFNTLHQQPQPVTDMHVVDLCSAPGGKTAQLCSLGFGRVDAIEISKQRSRSLHQNMQRLQMEDICNIIIADGRDFVPSSLVQGVLVDAPCSATGVCSRRPDVLRKSINLDELTAIQNELCVHAVDNILDIDGVLVYATCSLLKQEGEDQIQKLLSSYSASSSSSSSSSSLSYSLETIPFTPGELVGFDECIDEDGWLRVIPGVLQNSLQYCDGFFVARLRKVHHKKPKQ